MTVEIQVPVLGESVSEATVGKWYKAVGDAVAVDEVVCELETDKVALEVTASAAGALSEIVAKEGDNVEVGALLGKIDETAQGKAAEKPVAKDTPAKEEKPKEKAVAAPVAAAASGKSGSNARPAAAKLAAEKGIDVSKIAGTGAGGAVTKADVLAHISGGPAPAAQSTTPAAEVVAAPQEEVVPMTRLRRTIAKRLKDAQNTAAMLTTYNEVDMTAVMNLRKQYQETFEKKHGCRLGFMSFFAKACTAALKEIPEVNAEIREDSIVYKNYYNIGVAASTPAGLVVPVVRNCEKLGFADIEKEISRLGGLARDGKLAMEDMMGGTFTISNGGVFGSLLSSPILNAPQSGILGMHTIQKRPVVVNDEIVIRPMMYLSLSYDHRIVDGKGAVTFLVRVKENLEDPQRLVLDL
ncbi:MAG: 2-oxoglutarate dehydrogenase complex dihydrolipoyllysine-residue succinyltransferase [Alphaproteobacteria bacterium]|nr:2-oxoglutarate dehydrogenase complex dihydrolipoyllysine-residue succinyltransferase [Alphaproteobacteria bacterium]HPF46753.1 2-oxoglutarate dehydrogenase complex dihydrolipoyllysine-residue succinyltransferase [Emcibacteraceae bacterium]HRW28501.1 2-oxoglutarate dehydrogenase complex dihydrolipoyllysine-residue succinyltransferase [Emcibacteraceae bacterium]